MGTHHQKSASSDQARQRALRRRAAMQLKERPTGWSTGVPLNFSGVYNSRVVALVLSLLVSAAATALLSLLPEATPRALVLVGAVTFMAGFILIWTVLEYLVFGEIAKIYGLLENLKKRELKAVRRKTALARHPIQQLQIDILNMATRKQAEIEELKRSETYRREFIADISHELKTPLFAAQGFIHTLLDGAADEPALRERFLTKAANNLDGLGEMIQQLLTLSQLETGVLQMRPETFDLLGLAREVLESLEDKAAGRQITLRVERVNTRPLFAQADRQRIRQVLVNLTENGIKYGRQGGMVTITLDAGREQIECRIRDDGPGIPDEHLGRIFDRFYRVDKSRSKESGGSGLGLAIVRQIIEAHGSRVTAQSKVGKGTEFVFKLRRKKSAATATTDTAGGAALQSPPTIPIAPLAPLPSSQPPEPDPPSTPAQ